MQALPTFTPHFQKKLPGGTRRRADTIITTVRPAAAMMSTEHGVTNSTSPHHLEPAWLCSRYHHLHHRVPAVRSARLHSSPTFPPAITSTIQIVALRPPPRPPPPAMPWRRSTSAARRPRVSPSQLQRWDQRVREGRSVAAGFGAAERDAGGEAGARRHQLQRWDQRVREGRAVAAGFGAAERDAGGEAGARRHLSYNAGTSACEKGFWTMWAPGIKV